MLLDELLDDTSGGGEVLELLLLELLVSSTCVDDELRLELEFELVLLLLSVELELWLLLEFELLLLLDCELLELLDELELDSSLMPPSSRQTAALTVSTIQMYTFIVSPSVHTAPCRNGLVIPAVFA